MADEKYEGNGNNMYKKLISLYVEKCINIRNIKDAESCVKQNKLDHHRFPRLVHEVKKKYLIYIENTHRLHFIELLLTDDPKEMKQDF